MTFRFRSTPRAAAVLLAAILAIGAAPGAMAQAYPSKTVRILVGFAPGGAMDIVARTVGQKLAAGLGQTVVIDNKPGAASNIAIRQLIDSPPDGYTVMLVANGLTANPLLYTQQPFDPNTDVVPITLVARLPVVIAAQREVGGLHAAESHRGVEGAPRLCELRHTRIGLHAAPRDGAVRTRGRHPARAHPVQGRRARDRRRARRELSRISPEAFVYLGDTATDMITAKSAGMYAVGVTWGYRPAEELTGNGANTLISKPTDLLDLF